MSVLVSAIQMRAIEERIFRSGVTPGDLMLRAGLAIADWTERIVPVQKWRERRAVGLIGPGNNGGDTLIALALLVERGWQCAAIPVSRAGSNDLPVSPERLAAITQLNGDELPEYACDVVLDGIYGIGSRAELDDASQKVIAAAVGERNVRRIPLIAVDIPSGVNASTGAADPLAFPADVTLCLGLPKIGLVKEPAATRVGELVVLDIGITAEEYTDCPTLLDASQARMIVPHRGASAHKSTVGSVLIVGGADAYFGAPRLAGEAAMRIGAGLVTLAAPERIIPSIAGQCPELTFLPLVGSGYQQADAILALLATNTDRYNALVIGPGLGRDERATSLLDRLLGNANRHVQRLPLVLDADALNWLAGRRNVAATLKGGTAVLTPHPGEMARLTNNPVEIVLDDPLGSASNAARAWGHVVVLKSGYSVVSAPWGANWLAPRSMPEAATAGTGDVLAGMIGGLLAQGLDPCAASRLAIYVGAIAGRSARAEFGIAGVLARDVIQRIPHALRTLGEPNWEHSWLFQ